MVDLSVKSKYGLAAMLKLGLLEGQGPVQLRSISECYDIPAKYLESLVVQLKRAGLVASVRGAQGGYMLAKPSTQILVRDILTVLEGPGGLKEPRVACKVLAKFWADADAQILEIFSIPLSQLIQDQHRMEKLVNFSI